MTAPNTEGQEVQNNGLLDFRSVIVNLTYSGFETMTFVFRRSLGPELRKMQQEFMGKTKEEQAAEQQAYRVLILSDLLKARPINVPEYPDGEDLKIDFIEYFSPIDMDDVIDHMWTSYQAALYPKELTSMLIGS